MNFHDAWSTNSETPKITSEDALAIIVASADRHAIETCVERVRASLSTPVNLGDAIFHLTPYAGVAIQPRHSPAIFRSIRS